MKGLWNFPTKLKNRKGIVYFPTRALLPEWTTAKKQEEGEKKFSLGDVRVSRISTKFDISEMKLSKSSLFPELPSALDSLSLLPLIKRDVPVDDVEVVGWMQEAASDHAILTARMDEYNKYSRMDVATGDGYIPGVRTSNTHFVSRSRSATASLGYAEMATPRGNTRIVPGTGGTLIAPDLLAWAGVKPLSGSGVQWTGELIDWRTLARTPITRDVGFPSFRGIVAPNFFLQVPEDETDRARVSFVLSSDKGQSMPVVFRSSSNYTKVIDKTSIRLDPGVSEVSYIVAAYPSVPTVVLHADPESGCQTVLNEYRVEAE